MSQLEPNNIAARLKERIAFERPVYTLDALAATQTTWQQTEEAWAEIQALNAREREYSERLISVVSYRIYVRKYHNVQPDMRIIHEDKMLTIRAIINNPRDEALIEILAEEEQS